jgi:formate hydrogenlyase subunit 6/NADH:ubiquinone oxidoreductase subunit I
MEELIISTENFKKIVQELLGKEIRVIGIPEGENKYQEITDGSKLSLHPEAAPTSSSFKEYFFPKSEPIFFYKQNHSSVDLFDPIEDKKGIVVIGAKPCDASALPIISKVFNWDYKDDLFNKRYDSSLIIGMSCNYKDDYCFCVSTHGSPENTKGSDVFLTSLENNYFKAAAITPKGESFINDYIKYFEKDEKKHKVIERKVEIPEHFNYEKVKTWLDNNFENKFWDTAGEMCLGCAQCAFVCPTCHCFDIVDEQCSSCEGRRAKNWDACQFSLFTKHASGHNPRDNQEKRYRQRISHKFKYYNDKFGEILCTGCGRCARGCPVSLDILQVVEDINALAEKS